MRLLLTGTPGCGKTALAGKLARLLKAKLVDVNDIIEKKRIFRKNARGEKVVDLRKLEKILKGILRKEKNVVVDSHLLCELKLPCDRIIVLRCEPLVLKKRLDRRKYPAWKVRDNVLAELLDYCAIQAVGNYLKKKVVEVDFTKPFSAGKVLAKRKSDEINWMGAFNSVNKAVGALKTR
ncbi:MAG: AAA family ATPase [Candidatus Micrarchaeota archaeon]